MTRLLAASLLVCAGAVFAAAPPDLGERLPPNARLRIGSPRLRHAGVVRAVAFSGDGKLLASAGHDRLLSLWEVPSGHERLRLSGYEGDVTCVDFSADGQSLASGSSDGQLRLGRWTDKTRRQMKVEALRTKSDSVDCLAFWGDQSLAIGGDDGSLVVLDLKTGKERFRKQLDRGIRTVAWSPDGKRLATSGDAKRAVVVWDAVTGKQLLTFGEEAIQCLAFAPKGGHLVTWEDGGILRLWDASGKQVRKWGDEDGAALTYQIAFSPDGKSIFAGTSTGAVDEWDPATGKRRRRLDGLHFGRVTALAVREGLLATGGADGAVRLHDLKTGKSITPAAEPGQPIRSVAVVGKGQTLAALLANGDVRLYDRKSGKSLSSPKGRALAVAGQPASASLWLVDPKGKLLEYDPAKRTGKSTSLEDGPLAALSLSADGKVPVGVLRNGMLPILDSTGKQKRLARGRERGGVAVVSNDGSLVAAVGKAAAIALFEGSAGKEIAGLPGHRGGTLAAAFSPDGRLLASGGRDRYLRVWELQTRRERFTPAPHSEWVSAVAFSPDGRFIVSGSLAGKVQLYNARSGRLEKDLSGHRGAITSLAFADRTTLVSGGLDGTILVWDLANVKLDALAPKVLAVADQKILWERLGEDDSVKAALAIRELARDTVNSVKLVAGAVTAIDAKKVAGWIADLDSDVFKTRQDAFRNLARLGRSVEGPLRARLDKKPSVEQYRRIEELLKAIGKDVPQADYLRSIRAVELLEQIGTPAARKALKTLASGAADAELTRHAKAALGRLEAK